MQINRRPRLGPGTVEAAQPRCVSITSVPAPSAAIASGPPGAARVQQDLGERNGVAGSGDGKADLQRAASANCQAEVE